ncbi:segregation/condensation protein A [Candidatus Woesearchaeota archaeon]|nr:segregation/condensation protein A [Candidatus Woesearchaeota archaeon]
MNATIATPLPDARTSHEKVIDIVLKEDDLNWKELIYDLVRKEHMNPWDIDVSLLAEKFLSMIGKLREMDFRIGGKMVLTSSLLLKLKSDKLLLDDLQSFDDLLNGTQDTEEDLLDDGFEFEQTDINQFLNNQRKLVPRTPQPRERKVSVFDLVEALEQALDTDVKRQRALSRVETEEQITAPAKSFDLTETMNVLQGQLRKMFTKKKTKIFFHDLLDENSKQDKVFTFLPLLHLDNQRKIDLLQKEHFGDIEVHVLNREFM